MRQIWANNQDLSSSSGSSRSSNHSESSRQAVYALLTPREAEVVHHLAEGMSTRELSQRWRHRAYDSNYLSSIYDKLGVSTRVGARALPLLRGYETFLAKSLTRT